MGLPPEVGGLLATWEAIATIGVIALVAIWTLFVTKLQNGNSQ
jgi:hypothetical protein